MNIYSHQIKGNRAFLEDAVRHAYLNSGDVFVALADGFSKPMIGVNLKLTQGMVIAREAAEQAVKKFPQLLERSTPKTAFEKLYADLSTNFKDYVAGTTLTCAYVSRRSAKVVIAALGDTYAVVANHNALEILPTEHIDEAGEDLWGCLGDRANSEYHSTKPEIDSFDLLPTSIVLLGTDGLFPVRENQRQDDLYSLTHQYVSIARSRLKSPSFVPKRLISEASRRGSTDNATAVIILPD